MCLRGSQNKPRLFPLTAITYSFYNRGRGCLLRGTNWVFKSNGYSFVRKGLKQINSRRGKFNWYTLVRRVKLNQNYWFSFLSDWLTYCTNSCFIIIWLYFSTCFEQCCTHHQEVKLYYTAHCIVTLCRWPSGAQVERGLRTGRPPADYDDTRCCIIQFDLLMMSTTVIETCRGI